MAAIVGTEVTNVTLVRNTPAEVTYEDATNDGELVTDTETFDITPTVDDGRLLILVNNGCGADVTASIPKGGMFASTADMTAFDVDDGTIMGITIDTARYIGADGIVHVKITPEAETALDAASKVKVGCIQL